MSAATKDSVDIEVLVDDFVTFYVAGQETTSNLLSFALILTLQHPHVLERCQTRTLDCHYPFYYCHSSLHVYNNRLEAEVSEVIGSKTYVGEEELEKLEYTEQVRLEDLQMIHCHNTSFSGIAMVVTSKLELFFHLLIM